MAHSLFYIAGGALIVVALVLSFIGMRSDKFPSGNLLWVGTVVVALLVAATAIGAVELAQEEQKDRLGEANREADELAAEEDLVNQQAGGTVDPTPANGGAGPKDAVDQGKEEVAPGELDGAAVFVDTGCGSCHSLAELGADAQGTIGPNLDEALVDQDEAFIEQSIVDPSAEVAAGFPDGTMPATYKDQLTPAQITALVTFLAAAAGTSD